MKNRNDSDRIQQLRKQAEARLEIDAPKIADLSPDEVRRLVHELRTYQLELELQNEQLQSTQQELEESRDRYTDLYDFAPVGYLTLNREGLIRGANLTLTELLQVERRTLLNRPLSDFIHPEDQDAFYLYFRGISESSRQQRCRIRMLRQSDESFWAEVDSTPFEAPDDAKGAWLRTVISDITEQKKAEEDKRMLERQLLQAQKLESLGVLAGAIAHDFNNLLTKILGEASLALDDLPPKSPKRSKLLEIIEAAERAAELARQMLLYSGRGSTEFEIIDLNDLIQRMAKSLRVFVSERILLEFDLAENLPPFRGDPRQMRQIILNLVINASEAIDDRNGEIRLSTGVTDTRDTVSDPDTDFSIDGIHQLPEGRCVYLEVSDTGCGMDAETLERALEPFFSTKFSGRGLGMSVVLGVVRGHRGGIRIRSEGGKGTAVQLFFPASETRPRGFPVELREKDL